MAAKRGLRSASAAVSFWFGVNLLASAAWAQGPAGNPEKAAEKPKKEAAQRAPGSAVMPTGPAPKSGSMPSSPAPKGKLGTEPTGKGKLGTDPKPDEMKSRPPRPGEPRPSP
jgi:hypothetical protein